MYNAFCVVVNLKQASVEISNIYADNNVYINKQREIRLLRMDTEK